MELIIISGGQHEWAKTSQRSLVFDFNSAYFNRVRRACGTLANAYHPAHEYANPTNANAHRHP